MSSVVAKVAGTVGTSRDRWEALSWDWRLFWAEDPVSQTGDKYCTWNKSWTRKEGKGHKCVGNILSEKGTEEEKGLMVNRGQNRGDNDVSREKCCQSGSR